MTITRQVSVSTERLDSVRCSWYLPAFAKSGTEDFRYLLRMLSDIWRAVRPKQWIKNLLLLAAPLAASVSISQYKDVVLGILCFTLASILGYLLNDWLDRERDSLHEKKQHRPFASGKLGFVHYILLSGLCLLMVTALSVRLTTAFQLSLLIYLFISISYSLKIKSIPVLEMVWLSSGFLIRAIAGSIIVGSPPTGWFIVSVLFGSMTIVSAKRMAETRNLNSLQTRSVLTSYSEAYLRSIWTISIGVTVLTYALWIFEVHGESIFAQATIVNFTLNVLLYAHIIETKDAEEPESLLLKSPLLLFSILLNVSILIGVFYL